MALLAVALPYIKWRGDDERAIRPRFEPSPKLYKLGFKGEDLRHGKNGPWFSIAEVRAWHDALVPLILARQDEVARARARKQAAAPLLANVARALTVDDLFTLWFDSPRMKTGEAVTHGKRTIKPVGAATLRYYRQGRECIAKRAASVHDGEAHALDKSICWLLYEKLASDCGLAMARCALRSLSAALSWGIKAGKVKLPQNPCFDLDMQSLPPRVRAATIAEFRHLVATADAMKRPEIGDAIMLGVWTGQRQNDRLAMTEAGVLDGRRYVRQSKTGAIVEIFESEELRARLEAARARRAGWPVRPLEIIVNEQTRQAFKVDTYRHDFASVRDEAAKTMPSLADFRDQDLRDTAVTFLARADCTNTQIAQITGHSLGSIATILKHYLARHRDIGDEAIGKLTTFMDRQGETG